VGKRSRRRKDDDEGPVERPPAVDALLGLDRPAGGDGEKPSARASDARDRDAADEDAADGDGSSDGSSRRGAAEGTAGKGSDRSTAAARHPAPDSRLREVAYLVEEADHLLHLYRWILLTGEVPRAQDWLKREDWPHPDHVIDVFGSWQKFLAHAGVSDSPLLARLREAKATAKDLSAREKAQAKEATRTEDLHRQVESAKQRREEADAQRAEQAARADRAERALGAARRRADAAEARLAARREAAEQVESTAEAPDTRVVALQDELDAIRAHREELLTQVEELREAQARDQRTIARLSTHLAEAGAAPDPAAEADDEAPPTSVLEAAQRAAARSAHLVFTDAATASAADSPYRRPAEILEALEKLDGLAGRYAAGEMGVSLTQAATEAGLTYKGNVSELARSRSPHDYAVTHEGHRLDLGPHLALGSGSGAGFIARIYLHVADGSGPVPRGIYVGHVGRHLPDTTT
jgi:hypothetical protein